MLLLAYSGDAVYLYSTADDPGSEHASSSQTSPSPLRSPNPKRRNLEKSVDMTATSLHEQNGMEVDEQPALGVLDPVNLNADQDREMRGKGGGAYFLVSFSNASGNPASLILKDCTK